VDFLAAHAEHFQLQPAVVEQQDVAKADVLRQVLVVEADPLLAAHRAGGVEDELVVDGQRDLAFLEFADANLRPLQVAEDADGTAAFGGSGTDAFGPRLVVGGGAVGEIHAHHVDAGIDQAFENFRRRRSGAEGGYDLGVA